MECIEKIKNDDYCYESPFLEKHERNHKDYEFTEVQRFCYDSQVPGIPECWETGIELKGRDGKTIPYPGQSKFARKDLLKLKCDNFDFWPNFFSIYTV